MTPDPRRRRGRKPGRPEGRTVGMRISLLMASALALILPSSLRAQSADSAAVLQVTRNVFDAMRARDTTLLKSAFAPDARLTNAMVGRDGAPRVMSEKLEGFVTALAQPSPEVWDERTYNAEVRLDGNLATVWMEYDFYLGRRFSHCGVDAFQLARFADGWKIVALADTRRREGCPRPPDPAE